MGDVETATQALKAVLRESWGTLGPRPPTVIQAIAGALPLHDSIVTWYEMDGPRNLQLPWVVEWMTLFDPELLVECQGGYRHDWGNPEQLAPGWHRDWVVVGSCSGDPIIVDGSSGSVLMSIHGVGTWSPKAVAPNLASFLRVVRAWLLVWTRFSGEVRDEDGVLREDVLEAFNSDLPEQLDETHHKNLGEFLG